MFRRMFLFMLTNILVMIAGTAIIGFIFSYFNIQMVGYTPLIIICGVFGMGGSFISLMMSKWIAKKTMGLEIAELHGPHGALVQKINLLAKRAGLTKMPEVAIYDSAEINAFATGPSRNNSLVAVSTGLLNQMTDDEAEAVMAHEIAHIANGDMVTMALVQGVVNAFVMFLSWIASMAIENAMRGDDDEGGGGGLGFFASYMLRMALQTVFGILASPVVMWFSRHREFKADAGSAKLVGKEKMIAALQALKGNMDALGKSDGATAVMQISAKESMLALFSSHPPLDKRIAALRNFQ